MSNIIQPTPAILEQYHRDGFLVLPDLLSPDEVAGLKSGLERVFAQHSPIADLYHMQAIWRPMLFEHGPEFDAIIDHPGIANFVDAVLGDDCHLIAHTGLRTSPGKTISFWHLDDACRLPIPAGVQLDPRIPMPTYTMNMNYYLCDVDEELGPTQFLPGSHRAGRSPTEADNDANGGFDCQEASCIWTAECSPSAGPEYGAACVNGIDDDADGGADCSDAGCAGQPQCP